MSDDPLHEIKARIDAISHMAQSLPRDISFQRAVSSSFAKNLRSASAKLMRSCSKLTGFMDIDPLDFQSVDDVEEDMEVIIDTFDSLFEKADLAFDETNRVNTKKEVVQVTSSPMSPKSKRERAKLLDPKIRHASHLRKPQLDFKDPIDNSNSIFVPKLKDKPNAKKPFQLELVNMPSDLSDHLESLGCTETQCYVHPYKYEIESIDYPDHLFMKQQEKLFAPIQNTPLTWVSTESSLQDMVKKISVERELAIDLEAHSHRSYQGFTCLMQLSTRKEDFIVDTLAVREHMHYFNEVFTNPDIVKVMHGAESDIVWFQRDFGVYIVNLFDTFHASHVLEMPKHSLSHILQTYASVTLDKMYQLADWRIRPLPEEMARYAQEDTHYLLYAYDRIRNELLEKSNPETMNLMREVLRRSSETSLLVYTKPAYDSVRDWRNAAMKFRCYLGHEESFVFKYVHQWRDMVARREDESPHYVLANHSIVKIAKTMPKDNAAVISCCHPVSPVVRQYADELVQLIEKAIEDGRLELESKNAAALETIQELKKSRKEHINIPKETSGSEVQSDIIVNPLSTVRQPDLSVKVAKSSAMFSDVSDVEENAVEQLVPIVTNQCKPTMFQDDSDEEADDGFPLEADDSGNSEVEGHKKAEKIRLSLMDSIDDYLPKPIFEEKESPLIIQQTTDEQPEPQEEPVEEPIVLRKMKRTRDEVSVTETKNSDQQEDNLDFIVIDADNNEKTKEEKKEAKPKVKKKMKFANAPKDSQQKEQHSSDSKKKTTTKVFDPYSQIVIPAELKKKPLRLSTSSKTGVKQMTFRR